MYIHEAIKEAEKNGAGIIRESADNGQLAYRRTIIKATNTYDCCILQTLENGKKVGSCRNWNPTKDDLLADDWKVIELKRQQEFVQTAIS